MSIANLLEIPFITGFCFWQDIIDSKTNSFDNVNLLNNNNIKPCSDFKTICQLSDYAYVCGDFVNDIIHKLHQIKLPILYTISNETHYKITEYNPSGSKYVTIINISKVSVKFIEYLLKYVHNDIPFYIIDYQSSPNSQIKKLIDKRHGSVYTSILTDNINNVYKHTQILLILSFVDETFCRVAYEGLMNKIPILSTNYGNLRYLLNDYAIFLSDNPKEWVESIHKYYNKPDELLNISNKYNSLCLHKYQPHIIKNELYKQCLNTLDNYKIKKSNFNIGIFCPWCDQGLGIQCREYYHHLNNLNYVVSVFSYKPYKGTETNPKLQIDKTEWDYPNIYYSTNTREYVNSFELIQFFNIYKISKLIIVETGEQNIYNIVKLCKLFNIATICIPNIEIIKYYEITNMLLFDKVLTNNIVTENILKEYLPHTHHIGFSFSNKFYSVYKLNEGHCSKTFFCCGGLNSFSRKNIDIIIDAFYNIEDKKNFKLHVYIQDNEILDSRYENKFISNEYIIYHIKGLSYKQISELYLKHTVFIHMGGHEGLGLGFYEAIASGIPVLTIDTPPNNELIHEGVNGWLIPFRYQPLTDNLYGLTQNATISSNDLKNKMQYIISNYSDSIALSLIQNRSNINSRDFMLRLNSAVNS